MPLSPGTRLGPYEIAALIGVGGMGEVYRARDTNLRRDVAIKILPDSFASDAERLARFRREAETLAALNHQNIAHVYGLERNDTTTGLVMELVEGPTLAERIAKGPLPLAEALPLARQIADALDAAHKRGIVHRDLKPANIKLRHDGAVKVLDFGIAKALQPTAAVSGPPETQVANTPSLTLAGLVLGTTAYMSPEQARGKTVDQRTDVWAFGCVLYEMLAGRPAFDGEDEATTTGRVLEREIDMQALPADIPAVVRQTLRVCLQKDAKKRVRDIGDVKLALDGAFETHAEPTGPSPEPPIWRRRLALAASFSAGAAVLGLAAWQLWPSPEPRGVTRFAAPVTASGGTPVSISSDGKRVAYRGADSLIYVRDLDEFAARAIAGTETADPQPPCFSPDGTSIAYTTEGTDFDRTLRKTQLSGGAALTVAQGLVDANLCEWGDDGYIYVGTKAGIVRVLEGGGPADVVAAPSAALGELSFQQPRLLPNGTDLLYSVVGPGGITSLHVLNLSTRERKTVLDGIGSATFVPSRRDPRAGYLLYGLSETLYAAPFDLRRLEAGTPRRIANDVLGSAALSSATVSRSGTLAYLSGSGVSTGNVTLIRTERDGKDGPVLPLPPGVYGEVEISPDGKRAALSVALAQGADISIYDLDSARLTPLTFGGVNVNSLWSPDGRGLFFTHRDSFTAPENTAELRFVPADSSGPEVTVLGTGLMASSISADGTLLLSGTPSQPDVFMVALDKGPNPRVANGVVPRAFLATGFSERDARFSPDGRFVAYTSDESGHDEIYVVPSQGLGGKWIVSRGGGSRPRWNRNGRELFFVSAGKLVAAEVETSPVFRTLALHELFSVPLLIQNRGSPYDVSPDGTHFLLLKVGSADSAQPIELRVVVNWIDELEGTTTSR